MEKQFEYVTRLDIKFDHLQRMDINQLVKDCKDKTSAIQPTGE